MSESISSSLLIMLSWTRGYFVADSVEVVGGPRTITSVRGSLVLSIVSRYIASIDGGRYEDIRLVPIADRSKVSVLAEACTGYGEAGPGVLGFGFNRTVSEGDADLGVGEIDDNLFYTDSILGLSSHSTWRVGVPGGAARSISHLDGKCRGCGYDLRATPTRCPECGATCKAASPVGESPTAGN